MKSLPLLVELVTEELPPKALQKLSQAFAHHLTQMLTAQGLVAQDSVSEIFATPRRLAVRLSKVFEQAPDRLVDERLLPEKVGLDSSGHATPALLKKLAGLGLDDSVIGSLKKIHDGKLTLLYLTQTVVGQTLPVGLLSALDKTLLSLPIPKLMSYQLDHSTETIKFVRPAHGLIALHGSHVVAVRALGLDSTRRTFGHRFLGETEFLIDDAMSYETQLHDQGKVIASFEKRRELIQSLLTQQAQQLNCQLGDYQTLLDEVCALVEWPAVYVASFDTEFLKIPQECLILTMRTNQKYFPLFDAQGKLIEKFLLVSNMSVKEPKPIIEGNQKVVRPRLADARFFYEQDRKHSLASRVPRLAQVVYHNQLGTQLERVERLKKLAGLIAALLGTDVNQSERAAWLAKADLLTGMVGEFPELQGLMGRYYAQHDKEPDVVCEAIAEHYLPRFAGDVLPSSSVACAVALADKLDTLVGIFGTGHLPSGDKDPFALRRLALGIVRILVERELPVSILSLLDLAHKNFPPNILLSHHPQLHQMSNVEAVHVFIIERAKSYLRERDYGALEVESVMDLSPLPLEYKGRLNATREFLALPEAAGLAQADKRIRHILSKSSASTAAHRVEESDLIESAEKQLLTITRELQIKVNALLEVGQFTQALRLTAQLHHPVTTFFDQVLVNAKDPQLRLHRFSLLQVVLELTNRVTNLSKLAL